jgi:hypothetical protein
MPDRNIFLLMWAAGLVLAEVAAYIGLPVANHSQFERFVTISLFTIVLIVAALANEVLTDD